MQAQHSFSSSGFLLLNMESCSSKTLPESAGEEESRPGGGEDGRAGRRAGYMPLDSTTDFVERKENGARLGEFGVRRRGSQKTLGIPLCKTAKMD
jgi:hypothetical protein